LPVATSRTRTGCWKKRPTQPDETVAPDTRSAGRSCEGAFRDDGPDGIVADATEQVAVGIDDVLEGLILGVAAINA
jgi:hypothetical protein